MSNANSVYCPNCPGMLKNKIEIQLVDEHNKPISNMPYILKNSKIERKGMTDGNGMIRQEKLLASPLRLFLSGQKLADEMETRPLRSLRGESHSTVKPDAESKGCFYRYAVIGELCDKAPDIAKWKQAKFGLPYYHFPKEDEFKGLEFYGEDFNQRHVIEVCPFRAWSLILKHTPNYDIVNAYNLGLMSLLVYKDEVMVNPDSPDINMRKFINTPDTTTSFFYQQCFDLSKTPVINDASVYPAIVNDVPFKERYRPAIFLDVQQVKTPETFEHDTQMFFVENETQIIAAWRGTASLRDALTDGTYRPIPCPENILPGGKAKVHKGFLEAYQCMEKYFESRIQQIKESSRDINLKKLFICGHSLGGALALLHATELRHNNPLLYTYGMPRVLTGGGVKTLTSLNHFRHVNDADSVTSVPFDTNMDNWLFEAYGPLGTIFGFGWTLATLPTIPIQKSLPEIGEVYYHQGNTVSFFQARQMGEERIPSKNGIGFTGKKRWRMNGIYKFYLVPSIANSLDKGLENEQQEYVDSLKGDKSVLDEIFPQWNNPDLDTIMTTATDHFMGSQYQAIINNQLLSFLEPTKTPKLIASKKKFDELIHHQDASPLNAKRNTTFMALENNLHDIFKQDVNQNELLKHALERYKEGANEISM
ncbi:lipase family protein [Xenorhabdus bovienii]|uniref:lipase family protein n=1 Tax=Xenorhabdus bovienii TaxID=40576 RepID=UPI0023B2C83D|nr:lipase family protein [Xenorhabdus bovienii]MDE9465781.1 lipase family protein [Xenorhabdus bovienii]